MEKYKLLLNANRAGIEKCIYYIERFIADRQLIIYGGMAIDCALRLHNPDLFIYDELKVIFADFDFLTPNLLKDAYDLAEMLTRVTGSSNINVINAMHMRTLKIFYEGENVADIGYCPFEVFKMIPTLNYRTRGNNTVRVAAPIYQAIDMHVALAFPYANAPREAYMHRSKKDIARYNMLWDTYIGAESHKLKATGTPKHTSIELRLTLGEPILVSGLLAYARLISIAEKAWGFKSEHRVHYEFVGDEAHAKIEFETRDLGEFGAPLEVFVNKDLDWTHRPLLDLLPKSRREDGKIYYHYDHKFYPATVDDRRLMYFACAQHVLILLMTHYVLHKSRAHLRCYINLMFALRAMTEDKMNSAFLIGDRAWPSDGKNLSLSVVYWHRVQEANVADRLRLANPTPMLSDMEELQKVQSERPPVLDFSRMSPEQKNKFMNWRLEDSEYFKVAGERI